MSMDRSKRTRLAGCLWAAIAALAVTAPIAHAGDRKAEKAERVRSMRGALAPTRPVACADRTFASVFAAWHDRSLYTLADGGDFETRAAGWTLAGPASVALGSSPFLLGAALGASSLELAAGASAVSPPVCATRILSLGQGRFRIRRTASTVVQVRFTAIAGTVQLDDVYVDPRYNR